MTRADGSHEHGCGVRRGTGFAKQHRMTKRPTKPTVQPLQTIDLATLEAITGGKINWQYQMYRAGIAISQWDPSMVAANFLM